MPSSVPVGGMRMSVTTTVRRASASMSASRSGRSAAVPTRSISSARSSSWAMPSRSSVLSSASTTRIGTIGKPRARRWPDRGATPPLGGVGTRVPERSGPCDAVGGGAAGAGVGRDETGAMEAVAALWRSVLRRHWRGWLVLILLLAIGSGAGMACLAGARRTASAFDRYAEAGGIPDVNTGHGLPPGEAESTIEGIEGVASHATVVGFVGSVEGLDPTLLKYFIGSWESLVPRVVPTLREGRYPRPEQPDEVLVVGKGRGRPPASSPATRSRSRCSGPTSRRRWRSRSWSSASGTTPWRRSPTRPTTARPSTSRRPSRRPTRPSTRCGRPASSSWSPVPTPRPGSSPRSTTSGGRSTRPARCPRRACRTPSARS